jgi:hypothetical protein
VRTTMKINQSGSVRILELVPSQVLKSPSSFKNA